MTSSDELKAIGEKIALLRDTAEELQQLARAIPAVTKNTARLLASVKMLEMNISDCVELDTVD